jgi:hypothetical protein
MKFKQHMDEYYRFQAAAYSRHPMDHRGHQSNSDYHYQKMKESFYLERGYPLENMFLGPPHKRPFDGPESYNVHYLQP